MRILFIARASSIQTAHWLNDLAEAGWEIHLFPVDDAPPHPELKHVTLHDTMYYPMGRTYLRGLDPSVQVDGIYWQYVKPLWNVRGGSKLARRLMRYARPQWHDQAWRLVETIRTLQPDLVHSLGIQEASYFALHTKYLTGSGYPAWAVTNNGNDVQLMGQLHEHIPTIKAVLTSCDYYFCECQQDADLVRNFGFEKVIMPVIPVASGFDLKATRALRQPGKSSERQMILLRGYSEWFGRTLTGLRALELCADLLKDFRVTIYNATYDTKVAADFVSKRNKILINSILSSSPEDILRLKGQARLSLDLNLGGGINTAFLESLVMGAFPIQADTTCANEWAEDGKTAIFVPPEDPEIVAEALRVALTNHNLIDQAVEVNDKLVDERLDIATIKAQKFAAYEKIKAELNA